jgi:hypothetical protein
MSHTNTYIVSTVRKHKEYKAIVQSGNTRGAIKKFLLHVYPESLHCDMQKMPSSDINGRHISNYRVFDDSNGDFTITSEKIRLVSDFILIENGRIIK